ncbi:MAG: cytochrome c oxidase subunit II [Planctomycetes bacterium]|nr:cytochrome c oxidase subunit II [Planctomycetota bacterium]
MWKGIPLFPDSASTYSDAVDYFYLALVGISIFFTLLIAALVVLFAIRFRAREGSAGATQIHGSHVLELFWTAVPLVIVMALFVWSTKIWFTITRPPAHAEQYYVTGKQWMWKIQHPTGQREINTLHVPVNVPIQLRMISEDVIHSFFIPAFRVKRDVLPGRYSTMWFEATKAGTYHLFCAEYCGTKHSQMIGSVIVMEQEDYQRWLSGAAAGETPQVQGEKLFAAMRCDTCHTGQPGARGPKLQGLWGQKVDLSDGSTVVFNEDYVRESILIPTAKTVAGFQQLMPTYAGQLGEDQILSLIAYLKSLSDPAQGGAKP